MTEFLSSSLFREVSADAAFRRILAEILASPKVEAVGTGAKKVQSATNELLAYRFEVEDPRHRIVANEVFTLDLLVAVARFVWMISGNNRLADIAFYDPGVKRFSDDSIIVPGSSYGTRIRQASPGIDQLQGVINRLKKDKNSRRAAISIYQPTDAVRDSNDIPCAFGVFFHIRDDRLHTQLVMRSNNATILLPFNLFEFSLLAEMVAVECGVAMGPLSVYTASMHIYEGKRNFSREIIEKGGDTQSTSMPPMPSDPLPLREISRLVQFEADIRHRSEAISDNTIEEEIDKIRELFDIYWQQFAFLLLATVVNRRCLMDAAEILTFAMNPQLAKHLTWEGVRSNESSATTPSTLSPLDRIHSAGNVIIFQDTKTGLSFKQRAVEHEQESGERFSARELLELEEQFASRLAARGLNVEISKEEFYAHLAKLRKS